MIIDVNGTNYYLVYEPANFQNWMVLGIVPTDVVNAGMNKLQSITAAVVSVIIIALAVRNFHQANRSLNNLVGRNWTNMHLWADYLKDVSDEKEIDPFVAHAKEETGFTDFYFISREGNYLTVSDETGYLDLILIFNQPIDKSSAIIIPLCVKLPCKEASLAAVVFLDWNYSICRLCL